MKDQLAPRGLYITVMDRSLWHVVEQKSPQYPYLWIWNRNREKEGSKEEVELVVVRNTRLLLFGWRALKMLNISLLANWFLVLTVSVWLSSFIPLQVDLS